MNSRYNNQNMGYTGPMPNMGMNPNGMPGGQGMPPQNGMTSYSNNQQRSFINNGPVPPQPGVPGGPGPQNNRLDPNYDETIAKLEEEIEASKKADKKLIMVIVAIAGALIVAVVVSIVVNNVLSSVKNAEKSKMTDYVQTASSYIKNAKLNYSDSSLSKVTDDTLLILMPVGNDNTYTCVTLEAGGTSPFSSTYKFAYVGLKYNTGYHMFDYYFVGVDGEGNVIKFVSEKDLRVKDELSKYVTQNIGEYGAVLQTMYQSGKNHAKAEPSTYGDEDLTEFANKIGAKSVAILSKTDCTKLKG